MTAGRERRFTVQAWAASVALHGCAVMLAALLASQLKPVPLSETFRWNVSFVERSREQSVEPTVPAAPPSAPQPEVQSMQPVATTAVVAREVQTRQLNTVIQQAHPQSLGKPEMMERPAVQAIAQPALVEPAHEAVAQAVPSVKEVPLIDEPQPVERVPETGSQSMTPVQTPSRWAHASTVMEGEASVSVRSEEAKEPVKESVTDTREIAPPVVALSQVQRMEPAVEARVDSQPSQTTAVPSEPATSPVSTEPIQASTQGRLPGPMAVLPRESAGPPLSPESAQPAVNAARSAPAARADYGWLIDSIGRRLAELKRYPAAARLNGWEGKVVLRAVILADGHLAELTVQKSSGYEELDVAAMEAVRRACPLPMQRDLGRTKVALHVPVVYALSR